MFRANKPMAQLSRTTVFDTSVVISASPNTSPVFQNSTNCINVSDGNPVCWWVCFHSWRLLRFETLIRWGLGEKFLLFWIPEKSKGSQAAWSSEQSQSFRVTSKKWNRKEVGITQYLTMFCSKKNWRVEFKLFLALLKKKLSWMMPEVKE